jgi:hypothetical protein
LLEWIEGEAFGLGSPNLADMLVGRESARGPESAAEVISSDEVGEVLSELLVALVVEGTRQRPQAYEEEDTSGVTFTLSATAANQ